MNRFLSRFRWNCAFLVLALLSYSATEAPGTAYYLNGANAYSDAAGTTSVTVPAALTEATSFNLVTGASSGTLGTRFTGEQAVSVANGAYYLNCSGYFLQATRSFSATNAQITTANSGEVLGNTVLNLTNSTFRHNVYTANDGGINLSGGSSFYLGNTSNNGYGALLINGGGGINALSGENYVYLYNDITAAAPTLSWAAFRTSTYAAINVSAGATLHYIGNFSATRSATTDNSNLTKKGDGLLSVEQGTIGAVEDGNTKNWFAGVFNAQGGTTKLTQGANWYGDATVNVSNGATVQLDSTALAASTNAYTIAGSGFSSQGALNVTTSATSGKIAMTAASTIQVGNGATFTPDVISGAFALTKTGDGTLKINVVEGNFTSLTVSGGTVDVAKQAALAGKTIQVNSGAKIVSSTLDGLQNTGLVTLNGGTMANTNYTTLNNGLLLKSATVTSTTGSHANYGSFLLPFGYNYTNNAGETVRVNLAAASGTSSVTTQFGVRVRAADDNKNSVIYVDSGATLNLASTVTYSTGATSKESLEKGGSGTLKLMSGTYGSFAQDVFGPVSGAGNILVSGGTLQVSGSASLYSGSAVTAAEGATLLFDGTSGQSNAAYNINGTMKLAATNRVAGNIRVTGANALLDTAVNDVFGMYDLTAGATQLVPTISLKDGGTLTNSIKRTSSNDNTSHMTLVSDLVLDNGKITSYSIGRQAGNYGNYLLNGTLTVKNTSGDAKAVSTMDAYLAQIRNKSGNWTIQEGATLEICSKISSISNNNLALTIDGGGTFRPIVEKRAIQQVDSTVSDVTQNFEFQSATTATFKNATLDLTALGTLIDKTNNTTSAIAAVTNAADWQLFAVTGTPVNNSGSISFAGKVVMNEDADVQLTLTVADGKLAGETVYAPNFDIQDSSLAVILDENINWNDNMGLLDNYEFFASTYGSFASLSVTGGGDFQLMLNEAGNTFGVMVPEPSAYALLLLGIGLIPFCRRKFQSKE